MKQVKWSMNETVVAMDWAIQQGMWCSTLLVATINILYYTSTPHMYSYTSISSTPHSSTSIFSTPHGSTSISSTPHDSISISSTPHGSINISSTPHGSISISSTPHAWLHQALQYSTRLHEALQYSIQLQWALQYSICLYCQLVSPAWYKASAYISSILHNFTSQYTSTPQGFTNIADAPHSSATGNALSNNMYWLKEHINRMKT